MTTDTPTIDAPPEIDGNPVPAAEAFAAAIAATTHQHAAAKGREEDAPREPVQAALPIPRPPFDATHALHKLFEKRKHVAALQSVYAEQKRAAADAKESLDEANEELNAMLRQFEAEERDSLRAAAGEQLTLPHSATCSWERDHPGQTCMVCHQERELARRQEELATAAVADAITADAPVGVIVRWIKAEGSLYLAVRDGAEVLWTSEIAEATVFDTEDDAKQNCAAWSIAVEDVEIVPDPMAANPAIGAEAFEPGPDEPMPEPPAEPEAPNGQA
jgi:hypothetical protein